MHTGIENRTTPARISTHSRRLWLVLTGLLVLVLLATSLKDWWLTGNEPNYLFYALVPPVDILVTSLSIFFVAILLRQKLSFPEMLAISMGLAIVGQVVEIILKLIYYRVWAYPGLLWFPVTFGIYFATAIYALVHWGKVRWWVALLLTVSGLAGSLIVTGLFVTFTGLDTPGS